MSSDVAFGACPVPIADTDRVLLGHGSGGKLTAELIERLILPPLSNPILDELDDHARLDAAGARLAFTTDSYVVTPLFFPGGDIGELAVNGTVNDLAVGGARPIGLSLAFILEEGLELAELRRVIESVRAAAARAGVPIVTGDTKVVGRGACELLGLDPMHVANEGKLVLFVAPDDADAVLRALRAHPLGRDAARVGRVTDEHAGAVVVTTAIGGRRLLDLPFGEALPRIC